MTGEIDIANDAFGSFFELDQEILFAFSKKNEKMKKKHRISISIRLNFFGRSDHQSDSPRLYPCLSVRVSVLLRLLVPRRCLVLSVYVSILLLLSPRLCQCLSVCVDFLSPVPIVTYASVSPLLFLLLLLLLLLFLARQPHQLPRASALCREKVGSRLS